MFTPYFRRNLKCLSSCFHTHGTVLQLATSDSGVHYNQRTSATDEPNGGSGSRRGGFGVASTPRSFASAGTEGRSSTPCCCAEASRASPSSATASSVLNLGSGIVSQRARAYDQMPIDVSRWSEGKTREIGDSLDCTLDCTPSLRQRN